MRPFPLVAVLGLFCLSTLAMAQEFDPIPSFFDAQPKPEPKEQLEPIAPAPKTIGKIELKDDLKEYPIWLLIEPQGVRFLQSDEEIAIHQNQIPVHAFLVGCHEAEFKAVSDAKDRSFQLDCNDFALLGTYGTTQFAEVKGTSLSYSTHTKQIQLKGDKDAPVEARLNGEASETLMQADEITLTLQATLIQRQAILAGSRKEVTLSVPNESNFQLSAKNIVSLEMIPAPSTQGTTDSPRWNPDHDSDLRPAPKSTVPFYDDPSSSPKKNLLPTY